jgi:hypothetical protein
MRFGSPASTIAVVTINGSKDIQAIEAQLMKSLTPTLIIVVGTLAQVCAVCSPFSGSVSEIETVSLRTPVGVSVSVIVLQQ